MGRNPLVDFQLVDYEWRNDPKSTDPTFQRFSYGIPTFLPEEYLEVYPQGADQCAARANLTGTDDVVYDALLEHCHKKVDVSVQSYQTVATASGQQTGKLVWMTVQVTMPDVEPEHAMAMILPWCSPGFFPGIELFMNGGPSANGQPVRDRSRYYTVINELKRQMVLLPGDYDRGADGTGHKPPL